MFETATNLWLQAFGGAWLLSLMRLVSALGTTDFYMLAFLLLAFGLRLRPMAGVLLGLVFAGAVTGIAKRGFALPRPSEIDARVLEKGESGHALVPDGAADTFWGLPSVDAIEAVRAAGEIDYGFISGHASAAMVFAVGLMLFFGVRNRWAWVIAIGWALLMGVSRMYLGRHFLADVLGGWLVGALAAWLAWRLVRVTCEGDPRARRIAWSCAGVFVFAWFLLALRIPYVYPGSAGEIAGALACLWWLQRLEVPDERGPIRRVLRVLLALAVGFGLEAMISAAWTAGGLADTHPVSFLPPVIGYPLAIVGAFLLARGLRLYRIEKR